VEHPRGRGKRQACGLQLHLRQTHSRNPIHCNTTHTMFGPFRATSSLLGGLLWYPPLSIPIQPPQYPTNKPTYRKIPWKLSRPRKYRQRLRLKRVDKIVSIVDAALSKQGQQLKAVERWKAEMPSEAEMLPRDKYTVFDRKVRGYRKGIHSMFLVLFSLRILG
jgi:hypothetical protein